MESKNKNYLITILIRLIGCGLLVWALDYHPYAYYIMLRWVVSVINLLILIIAIKQNQKLWMIIAGIFIVIFNPIFPIHIDRELWQAIDVVATLELFVSIFFIKPMPKISAKEIMNTRLNLDELTGLKK